MVYTVLDLLPCADVDECSDADLNMCDTENGVCVNTVGNYTCRCINGFTGDGFVCTGAYTCIHK